MAQVPAGAHTLQLLTYLAHQATPVAASSMARDLALPRSTTYHLLQTMMDAGYVTHYPEQKVYGLGAMSVDTGAGFVMGLLSIALGFGLIWHIWWMAIVGFVGMIVVFIARSFDDDTDYYVPAAEVERIENERFALLAAEPAQA